MNILLITANLGAFDKQIKNHISPILKPGINLAFVEFTDTNFPPRHNALHSRMQAKIPKMLAWEYFPEYDYYIWIDGSVQIINSNFIQNMVNFCAGYEIALIPHKDRKKIRDELEFVTELMRGGSAYLLKRYENELMQEQVNLYTQDKDFIDEKLFVGTVFCYSKELIKSKPEFFKEWYYHCARYSVQDQLSLPYILHKHKIKVKEIDPQQVEGQVEWLGDLRNRIA